MGEAGRIAQWVKILATKPNNLSLNPGLHMVEGENQLLQVVYISLLRNLPWTLKRDGHSFPTNTVYPLTTESVVMLLKTHPHC